MLGRPRDGVWAAAEALRGPGAGLDSQGVSGQRAGHGPVGHRGHQEGCGAGLHGKGVASPPQCPSPHGPAYIRPSLVLHLRRLAGALPVCLKKAGPEPAPPSGARRWMWEAALERSVR